MKPSADAASDTAGEDAAPTADDDLEVDGIRIAEAFGVPAAFFLAEMRRGNVHGNAASMPTPDAIASPSAIGAAR